MAAIARRLESQFRLPQPAIPVLVPPLPPVDSGVSEAVEALKKAHRLTSGSELIEALERRRRDRSVPTTLAAVDILLDGGLSRGKMTEISGRGARFPVVVATLASATSIGEAAALIDIGDAFDPHIGEAVILDAGLPPLRSRVPDAAWVRLARAAEAHGSALLVSAPYPITGTTSEAMVRAEAARGKWNGGLLIGIDTTMRLEKHRRKRPGQHARLAFEVAERA